MNYGHSKNFFSLSYASSYRVSMFIRAQVYIDALDKVSVTEKSEELVAFCMRKAMIEKWKYMRKISMFAESFSKWI